MLPPRLSIAQAASGVSGLKSVRVGALRLAVERCQTPPVRDISDGRFATDGAARIIPAWEWGPVIRGSNVSPAGNRYDEPRDRPCNGEVDRGPGMPLLPETVGTPGPQRNRRVKGESLRSRITGGTWIVQIRSLIIRGHASGCE